MSIRASLRERLPLPLRAATRALRSPGTLWERRRELAALASFVLKNHDLPRRERARLAGHILVATYMLDCPHSDQEILQFVSGLLTLPRDLPGVLVEAGCFKGCSTAKFSRAAALLGRRLVVFDSFQGLPPNQERHGLTLQGETPDFSEGKYAGSLEEVRENVPRHGRIDACEFIPGWFEHTMPGFGQEVAAAYLDVDLIESTRTCIRYLWPLIVPGGLLFSQDAHLPRIIDLLRDPEFWRSEIGCAPPEFHGLGSRKVVWTRKPGALTGPFRGS